MSIGPPINTASPWQGDNGPELGESAVVLGASIGGLLAAGVLADFYNSVTVVERDILPDGPAPRRGVAQGDLPHLPAARGVQIMGELFPGFVDELVAGGARVWNDGDLSRFWVSFGGHRFLRSGTIPDPDSIVSYYVSRPFIEWILRRRALAVPNVEIVQGHDAVRLTSVPKRDRVTGVVVARRDSGAQTTLAADLVVDATGRGSRAPVFLDELGYPRPREDQLTVHVSYAGLPVHLPPGTLREYLAFSGPEPNRPVCFAMFAGENDTYRLAVQTVAGQKPPADRAALLDCLADMAPRHVLDAARRAEPLADMTHYRFPSNRWRRYDQLGRMPGGLIVMGDALCNFNPLYGQGMSVAAIEAHVLRHCLQQGDRNLPQRFFRASAKEIRVAWQAAVASDLALPQIAGRRSLSMRIFNAYLDRVLAAAETDPAVVQQFLRSMNLVDRPSHLLRPSTMLRVLKKSRKRGVAQKATSPMVPRDTTATDIPR
ncbi:FAD-dependent monooxygenase [Mycolicibacter terrae]|uniref:2-polyprenyl-6-methoxyphenol hydroxylase-like oxidoreductase n=2 Tax=Mycolicibacter TaxID=1073531 RepID=A0A1A2NKR1_MYCSD|nr:MULTISPECIES: FAD-binding protein [Mycolicibacter]OBH15620.1 2-polyprenyl-6-methoxyphenol hydroxylase-like oxidoreductase [Mycolicibacter sinensis]OBI31156.1 2-polyprenyl-6-methoxyphenol hydroxylase-like oxidoreductase [Mycolicibacter sinensis]RRR46617.1 FAD-dependent monooxygenase [Mycolicibacter terrae]